MQLKVNAGHYIPYYYVGASQRIAFVRVGDENLPVTAKQMVRLVLNASDKTFESLHTGYKAVIIFEWLGVIPSSWYLLC